MRSHCKLHISYTKKELHILQGPGKHKTILLAFIFGWNSLLDSRWQSRDQGSSFPIMNLHSPDVPCCWEHLIAWDFQAQQSYSRRTVCLQSQQWEKLWQCKAQVNHTHSAASYMYIGYMLSDPDNSASYFPLLHLPFLKHWMFFLKKLQLSKISVTRMQIY